MSNKARSRVLWHGAFAALLFATNIALVTSANADIVVSSAQTQDMSCSGDVCEPTATDAILNVSDLENMLAAGNVTVMTAGSGVQANNIDVEAALTWSSGGVLTLDTHESLNVDSAVSIDGTGGLSVITSDGAPGEFSITRKGHIAFANLSSQLTIEGVAYTLVDSVSSLASAIAANPSGDFALANSYDAAGDGTYTAAPVQTEFDGMLEGLGNSISNLSISEQTGELGLGLLSFSLGTIEHLGVLHVAIVGGANGGQSVGALLGGSTGSLFQDFATGKIRVQGSSGSAGGLVGVASGSVEQSSAGVRIDARNAKSEQAGGLAGTGGDDDVTECYASGDVAIGSRGYAGGLIGGVEGRILNSYATGAVTGKGSSNVGGFAGQGIEVYSSYSTGAVRGKSNRTGGFVGQSYQHSLYSSTYWDTTTSGTTRPVGRGKSEGITGKTTDQLQAGLPQGFDSAVWAENQDINNGLPYLIANPPAK